MKATQIMAASALAMFIGTSVAAAQQANPSQTKGVTADLLTSIDLGKQGLDDYKARKMRMRKVTIAPGGVFAAHSHHNRPGMDYVLEGSLLEHRDGLPDHTYKAGDVLTEDTSYSHWVENKGNVPVVLIAFDLFKE